MGFLLMGHDFPILVALQQFPYSTEIHSFGRENNLLVMILQLPLLLLNIWIFNSANDCAYLYLTSRPWSNLYWQVRGPKIGHPLG